MRSITRVHRLCSLRAERGFSIIILALTLPVLIVATLTAIQLFLFFRAAAVVQRAAGEAAEALAAAQPGDKTGAYKYVSNTISAGTVYNYSSVSDYVFYERNGGPASGTDLIELPFSLCRYSSGCGTNLGMGVVAADNPGVQYLPLVSVYTCLEPRNETAHDLAGCSSTLNADMKGFLTYLYPATLDFDGDTVEDISFFYPNSGDDWHVITSSSGALNRYGFRMNLGEAPGAGQRPALPCPADYDGDGKTDFCVMSEDNDSAIGFSNTLTTTFYLHVMLSSQAYQKYTIATPLTLPTAGLPIPVPGKWAPVGAAPTADRFAVVLVEVAAAGNANFLGTFVWPLMTVTQGQAPTFSSYTPSNSYTTYADRPAPGRFWRPCHSDVDADGKMNICFGEWEGGYHTAKVAGVGYTGGFAGWTDSTTADSLNAWSLYYPRSTTSPGLFVVGKNTHQIMMITGGSDGIIRGNDDGEWMYRVAGGYEGIEGWCGGYDGGTIASPDPLSYTFQCGGLGSLDNSESASMAKLNNPVAVAGRGVADSKLFVADYGNLRVRMITPAAGTLVDGQGTENIINVAGGTILTGVTCPALKNPLPANCNYAPCNSAGGTPTANGTNQACDWDCYATPVPTSIDPTCVTMRPLSLEVIDSSTTAGVQEAVVIGDEKGVVWIMYPGADATWRTTDDTLELLIGTYGTHSNAIPSALSSGIGYPSSISAQIGSSGYPSAIFVASRNYGTTATEKSGGVFRLLPGADSDFRAGTRNETVAGIVGQTNWPAATNRPVPYAAATGASGVILKNPTAIVSSSLPHGGGTSLTDPTTGLFIAGWWHNDNTISTYYEHSILQFYSTNVGATLGARTRWLNNPHLNSWGMRTPNENNDAYWLSWTTGKPVATIPIRASAGVALSPDNRFLYVSETELGYVLVVALDQDGDDLADMLASSCAGYSNCSSFDTDADGDGNLNSAEGPSNTNRDPYQFETTTAGAARPMDTWSDMVVWAKPLSGNVSITSMTPAQRLEWFIDRFAARQTAASPGASDPEQEQAPFTILGNNTIVALVPRGALHSTPVWSGGPTIATECDSGTAPCSPNKKTRLSPVIMASRTPTNTEIKDASGQRDCANDNWYVDEANLVTTGLDQYGAMVSACGSDVKVNAYADGREVGVRRIHPAKWTNQFYGAGFGSGREIGFLDRDGVDGRNPVLYRPGTAGSFLMVHVGNIDSTKSSTNCPGYWARGPLNDLATDLRNRFGFAAYGTYDTQFDCTSSSAGDPFFTNGGSIPLISTMADYHGEWTVTNTSSTSPQAGYTGVRTATSGPVIETAYKVLEEQLRVLTRNSVASAYHARVTIVDKTVPGGNADDSLTAKVVKVEYVFPLLPGISRIFGGTTYTIERQEWRQPYNFGRNL